MKKGPKDSGPPGNWAMLDSKPSFSLDGVP